MICSRPIIRAKNVESCQPFNVVSSHKQLAVPYDEAQLRGMLMRFDTNGDGRLSKDELRSAFKTLGSRAPRLRAFLALFHADRNRNGHIDDADEFDVLVKYASKFGYSVH